MNISPPHFILLHGTGGSPQSNWLPWLAAELRKRGERVSIPQFPTPEGQTLSNWRRAFAEQVGELSAEMFLVGHSMGAGAILRIVEASSKSVRGIFLVAGWEGMLGLPEFDPLIESFYADPFDFERIKKQCGSCRMYHGDNDPYVPLTMGTSLAERLGAPLTIIPGGGHLNSASGFTSFPLLLEDITQLGAVPRAAS